MMIDRRRRRDLRSWRRGGTEGTKERHHRRHPTPVTAYGGKLKMIGGIRRALLVALLTLGTLSVVSETSAQAGSQDCFSYAYTCTPGYTGANANGSWAWSYYGAGW